MARRPLTRRYGRASGPCPRPFSGARYSQNEDRVKTPAWPCALCGKAVQPDDAKWVTVVDGGARFVRVGDIPVPEDDPGHMGSYPVGPDCGRRLAKCGVVMEART